MYKRANHRETRGVVQGMCNGEAGPRPSEASRPTRPTARCTPSRGAAPTIAHACVASVALTSAALIGLPSAATANPDLEHGRVAIDLQVGAGMALTSRTSDAPGSLSLLYGSGYSGLALHGGASVGYELVDSLRIRLGLGMTRATSTGYAELADPAQCPSTCRRELRFGVTSFDVPIGVEYLNAGGGADFRLGLGLGLRAPITGSVTDTKEGFVDAAEPPEIRIQPSAYVWLETGVAVHLEQLSIPVLARISYNPSYPGTTAGRLDSQSPTPEEPGAYWVDHEWIFMMLTGVELWP